MQQGGTAGANGKPTQKKERRLTCELRRNSRDTHCSGINSVAHSPQSGALFTASRDCSIKRWGLGGGPTPTRFEASFERHVDWVNDIELLGNVLVSCSSDRTVNIWNASSPGVCVASYQQHSDYVTCLSAAHHRGWVASAGLRGEILLWDLQAAAQAGQMGSISRPHELSAAGDGSIYSLAFVPNGSLLASGCTNKVVHVWDPRVEGPVMSLKGHNGNVRALTVSEGNFLVSGASDGKVRLWDLGQQRCSQVFSMHSDSVWSLQASEGFGHIYSGSRDGAVFRTCLSTRASELLLQEFSPVLSLALDSNLIDNTKGIGGSLWVATTSSTINRWEVPAPAPPPMDSSISPGAAMGEIRSPSVTRPRGSAEMVPVARAPSESIPGLPALTLHTVLNDRWHVLTKDTAGRVELWDLTTGSVTKDFGQANFKETVQSLFQPVSVPQWLTTDIKSGSLHLHLDTPQCFSAEIYAQDLGMPDAADDLKVNFGEQLIKGLLSKWAIARSGTPRLPTDGQDGISEGSQPYDGIQGHFLYGSQSATGSRQLPCPAIICESLSGMPWRRPVDSFDGSEVVGEDLPLWVADCSLHSRLPAQREMKCAFVLQPVEGSPLPSMLQTRLNAPRILRIAKVASYVVSKLAEQNIAMVVQPPVWSYGNREVQTPASSTTLPVLEILCNGVAVPFEMSLESVRAYIWKRSDDLVLEYMERAQSGPAPLPSFQPPS